MSCGMLIHGWHYVRLIDSLANPFLRENYSGKPLLTPRQTAMYWQLQSQTSTMTTPCPAQVVGN